MSSYQVYFLAAPPAKILRAWHRGELQLIVSPEILEEYYEVCERISVRYPDIDITRILLLIARNSQVVDAPTLGERVSRDADDDKFIACAVASGTQIIISGDNDLLTVPDYENVQIVTPRDFVLMPGHLCPDQSSVSLTPQTHWRSARSAFSKSGLYA